MYANVCVNVCECLYVYVICICVCVHAPICMEARSYHQISFSTVFHVFF